MYGDNTAQLREALGTLMQITRNGSDVDDPPADAVELVGSFRHSITVLCQKAVRASNPHAELGGTTPRTRGPAEELRYSLAAARSAYAAPLPTVDQLATPHPNYLVDLWRQAAKGAALGEHDFAAGLSYGHLTDAQAMTVLKDASEITPALTGLDRRSPAAMRGWAPIDAADWIGHAAAACAAPAGATEHASAVAQRQHVVKGT